MNFSDALESLKAGERISRSGWNGKDMYIDIKWPEIGTDMDEPYLFIKPVGDKKLPWLISQQDVMAEDWELYQAA